MKNKLLFSVSLLMAMMLGGIITYTFYTKSVVRSGLIVYGSKTYVVKDIEEERQVNELIKNLDESCSLATRTQKLYKQLYLDLKEEKDYLERFLIIKNTTNSLKKAREEEGF